MNHGFKTFLKYALAHFCASLTCAVVIAVLMPIFLYLVNPESQFSELEHITTIALTKALGIAAVIFAFSAIVSYIISVIPYIIAIAISCRYKINDALFFIGFGFISGLIPHVVISQILPPVTGTPSFLIALVSSWMYCLAGVSGGYIAWCVLKKLKALPTPKINPPKNINV